MPKITITSDSALNIRLDEKETIGGVQYQPIRIDFCYPAKGEISYMATLIDVDTFAEERTKLPHNLHYAQVGPNKVTLIAEDGEPVTEEDMCKFIKENYPNVITNDPPLETYPDGKPRHRISGGVRHKNKKSDTKKV
jgi:hypothetical protein